MNLKQALLKAYAEQGLMPPAQEVIEKDQVVLAHSVKKQLQVTQLTKGKVSGVSRVNDKQQITRDSTGLQKISNGAVNHSGAGERSTQKNSVPQRSRKLAHVPKYVTAKAPVPTVHIPKVTLATNAKCNLALFDKPSCSLLQIDLALGQNESIDQITKPEVHEMAFGLDFGTSSVKVVICDMASDKAYAIPFLQAEGVNAYLLPSRVYEATAPSSGLQSEGFNLFKGDQIFRDLKLSLLGNPDSVDRQVEVIALLALVIKRSRAWFFETHKAIYKRVKCIWQLRIGLPAATVLNNRFFPLFERLIRTAWTVAAWNKAPQRETIMRIRNDASIDNLNQANLEIEVVPEISAQIYGFVVSSSFDPKAANRFLMVDVGAGTVDSSLFRVVPGRGGQWDFEFYTAVVRPNGIANLHAFRVDWWLSRLSGIDSASDLMKTLRETKFATDLGRDLPLKNSDYFTGVKSFDGHPDDADAEFFDKKLLSHVQGSTIWRAQHEGFLSQDQLKGLPMFLCGGGARSPFYLDLERKLQHMTGYSWLSTEAWQLAFPVDLEVTGIDEIDFDRLSVAYGLSKFKGGKITQALPMPKVPFELQSSFTDRYIDKDQT